MNKLSDIELGFKETSDSLIIEKAQEITPEFIQSLKDQRTESKHRREGDMMRVASIPVIIIEKWIAEGFDFWNEPARKIVAKLKAEGLDYFVTTDKQI